jgi:hypothetical protein
MGAANRNSNKEILKKLNEINQKLDAGRINETR